MTRTLLAVLLVVGCASTPEPSVPAAGRVFQVPMSQEHFGTITVFVFDEIGIVTGAQKVPADQLDEPLLGDIAVADPDTRTLFVGWIGGVCRFGPTVTLTGQVDDLLVTVRPEDGQGLPPGIACADIGLSYWIGLQLAVPVQQDAVDFEIVR